MDAKVPLAGDLPHLEVSNEAADAAHRSPVWAWKSLPLLVSATKPARIRNALKPSPLVGSCQRSIRSTNLCLLARCVITRILGWLLNPDRSCNINTKLKFRLFIRLSHRVTGNSGSETALRADCEAIKINKLCRFVYTAL